MSVLEWTKDPPTEAGCYLMRHDWGAMCPVRVGIGPDGIILIQTDDGPWRGVVGSDNRVEWAGPIPPPRDPDREEA